MVTRSKNRVHVLEEDLVNTTVSLRNSSSEVEMMLRASTMDSSTVSCHPMVTRSRNRTNMPRENSIDMTISLRNSNDAKTVARIWKYRQHLLTHVRLLALRQLSYEVESVANEEKKNEDEKCEPEAGINMEFESEEDKEACEASSAPPNHSNEHIDGVINGEISEYTKLRGPRTIADDVADIELYNEPSHSTTTATPINSSSSYRYRQDMSELREDLERIVFLKRVIEQLKAGMELGVHHGVNIALQIRTRADPFQPFKSL
ncbi:hypothetical protein Y032_0030g2235 [Ancylostoma ceylanicum]|nr:hypothetical protein Y032_0030g2235 [Ancylostoma ceylanicum]